MRYIPVFSNLCLVFKVFIARFCGSVGIFCFQRRLSWGVDRDQKWINDKYVEKKPLNKTIVKMWKVKVSDSNGRFFRRRQSRSAILHLMETVDDREWAARGKTLVQVVITVITVITVIGIIIAIMNIFFHCPHIVYFSLSGMARRRGGREHLLNYQQKRNFQCNFASIGVFHLSLCVKYICYLQFPILLCVSKLWHN